MRRILILVLLGVVAAWAVVAMDTNEAPLTVDMSKTVTNTNAPPVDLAAEVARAKAENKLLLLEFGSSDSCPPCVALQKYVFSTPEFQAYAKSNLNFVRLDYPNFADLRPDTMATNVILAQQFKAFLFPTFVALDKNGTEFWRAPVVDTSGAVSGAIAVSQFNPKNFMALIEEVKKKEK